MPHLQVVNQVKHNSVAYKNLLYYIARPDKCRNYSGSVVKTKI